MSGPCRASDAFSLHHPLRHPRQLITLTSRRQAEGQQVPSVLSRLHSALLVGSGSGSGSGQRCTFRSNIPYMAAGRPWWPLQPPGEPPYSLPSCCNHSRPGSWSVVCKFVHDLMSTSRPLRHLLPLRPPRCHLCPSSARVQPSPFLPLVADCFCLACVVHLYVCECVQFGCISGHGAAVCILMFMWCPYVQTHTCGQLPKPICSRQTLSNPNWFKCMYIRGHVCCMYIFM